VDAAGRRVMMTDGELAYDFLVVATGVTHSYFGNDDWARYAPGLKTLDDAHEIRRRVLLAFERAERALSPSEREQWLTFVIIGGGPTGVELAGSLVEIARHTLVDEFRAIDPSRARVVLLEGGPRILSTYPETLSRKAQAQLQRLGVEVRIGARVTDIDANGVTVAEQGRIETRTMLWAAGVQATELVRTLPGDKDRSGRIRVNDRLQVTGHDEIYVAGDLALVIQQGTPVPGVAYAAKQMGSYVGSDIARRVTGSSVRVKPFAYRDRGSLATIGRNAAIAVFPGGVRLTGRVAWWVWLFVHIFFLIGFRNRISTLFDWAWAYVTYQRHARLILGVRRPQIDETS
jgi:NADH:ubiquinone reductase (H+-translocating)